METGQQTASMEAWEAIGAPEQVEIITRAAKRAAYIAGAYGVTITPDAIEMFPPADVSSLDTFFVTGFLCPAALPPGREK